jgi:four helix bundle protein
MDEDGDRLDSYEIYRLARQLFDDFWDDSLILERDLRGRELARQQTRSVDSICSNIEEGFGRGSQKEWAQHLKISRGEARESRGRYHRCKRLFSPDIVQKRVAVLSRIIAGLTNTINTVEKRRPAK